MAELENHMNLEAASFEPRSEVLAKSKPKLQPRVLALIAGGLLLAYALSTDICHRDLGCCITADGCAGGLNRFGGRLLINRALTPRGGRRRLLP